VRTDTKETPLNVVNVYSNNKATVDGTICCQGIQHPETTRLCAYWPTCHPSLQRMHSSATSVTVNA